MRPMPSRSTEWVRVQRVKLIQIFGGSCKTCGGADMLEFAHIEPTDVIGIGRGSYQRVKDVLSNPEAYTLLCQPCHKEKDGPLWRNPSDEYRKEKRRLSRERHKRKSQSGVRSGKGGKRLEGDGRQGESERRNRNESNGVEHEHGGSESKKRQRKKRDG